MTDLVRVGFAADTSGLKKAQRELDNTAKAGAKTDKAIASNKKGFAQLGRASGQAGIQIQQFIGQVQGGQSAMLALSQQSADLGFVLGAPLLGAVVGIGASMAGLLIPNLLKANNAMSDLEKAINAVDRVAKESDGVKFFTEEISKLGEESQKAARLMVMAAQQSAKDAGRAAAQGISEEFNKAFDVTFFEASFDALKTVAGTAEGVGFTISQEFEEIGEQFGLTGIEARKAGTDILVAIREMELAVSAGLPDAGEKINKFQEMLLSLAETSGVKARNKILSFSTAISEYVEGARNAAEMSEFLGKSLKETGDALPTEKTNKLAESIDSIVNSLEGQIIALEQGEEAALRFSIAQSLGLEATEKMPVAINEQINELFRLKDVQEQNNEETRKSLSGIEKMFVGLEMQRQKLRLTSDEFGIYKAKIDAINAGASPEMVKQIEKQVKAIQKLKSEMSFEKDLEKNIDSLTSKVENFGGAWSRTGNIIADSLGDAVSRVSDFASKMEEITTLQDGLTKARQESIKAGKDTAEIDAAIAKLNEESLTTQIGAVSQLAGVTSKMFKENSKERKALHAIEMAFAAAEIAIATEKAIVNAVNAVATQGQGDPYTAFARIASMIALMGGVLGAAGIAFSAGGGGNAPRATNTGTGTVFGSDEASSSIANSLDMFEDIELDQLAELRGIRDSMQSLSNSIGQLTKMFIVGGVGNFQGALGTTVNKSGFGTTQGLFNIVADPLWLDDALLGITSSLFGKTTKKVIDQGISFISQSLGQIIESGIVNAQAFFDIEKTKKKLFGLSKKVTVSTEFQDIDAAITQQMGDIFGFIGETVIGAAKSLGFETVNMLVQTGVRESLNFSSSSTFIELEGFFVPVFEEMELSLEDALKNFQVDIGDISFEGLSDNEIQERLEAVFSQQADLIAEFLVPSITEYQKVGEGSFETLQRVAMEQAVFNDSMKNMGFNLSELSNVMKIDVAQSIIDLIGGIDKFKDATSEYFEAFFSEQEKFDILTSSLTEVFDQLGFAIPNTREEFRNLVESLDLTTEEGQRTFATLMELVPGMDAYLTELEKQQGVMLSLNESLSIAFSALEDAVSAEKDLAKARMESTIATAQAQINVLNEQRSALESQQTLLVDNLAFAESQLTAAFDAEKISITDAANARISALNNEKSAIQSSMNELLSLAAKMSSAAGNSISVLDALESARSGDFSLAKQLNVSAISDKGFSSAEELEFAQAVQNARLSEIGKLAGSQASTQERMLSSIDRQISLIESNANDEINKLDEQLMALLGIDESVPSIEEAIKLFQQAQSDLEELNFNSQINKIDEQIAAAQEQIDIAQQAYDDEIARLDAILEDNEAQINALLGIDTSVMSVTEAINNIASIIQENTQDNSTPPVDPMPQVGDIGADIGVLSNESVTEAIKSSTRANAETADLLQKIYRGEISVRVVNP